VYEQESSMSWQVLGWLAFAGLLIGSLLWRRSRPKQDIAWPPVSKARGKSAVIPNSSAQYGGWLSFGGIDNSGGGPDGGDGSSAGSGH
jgi:hypothetical protein